MIHRLRSTWNKGRERLAGRTKVQATLYYASSSLVCQALRFVVVMLGTRLMDANQFGLFTQAALAFSFVPLIREIGQNNALISYPGDDRRFTTFNFQLNLVLGTVAALLLLGVLKFFPGFPPTLRRAAPLLAVTTLSEALLLTAVITAQRGFRFPLTGATDISGVTVYLFTLVALVHRMEGFLVLLYAQMLESITRLLILGFGQRWRFVGWSDGKDLRDYYFRRNAPLWIPQNFLQTATAQTDYLLLNALGGVYELGVYERMLQFVRIPWSLSINLLDRVLLISYSKDQGSAEALRATLRKARWMVLGAATGATLATTLAIVLLFGWFVGASWAATILHHWWAALPLAVLVPLVWNHNIMFQGTGNPKQLLRISLASGLGEAFLGGALLLAGYGASGMLIARGTVSGLILILQSGMIRRLLRSIPAAPVKA